VRAWVHCPSVVSSIQVHNPAHSLKIFKKKGGGVDADQVSLSPDRVRLFSGDYFAGRRQNFLKQIARPSAEPIFVRGGLRMGSGARGYVNTLREVGKRVKD
jgi:hypothetical protein